MGWRAPSAPASFPFPLQHHVVQPGSPLIVHHSDFPVTRTVSQINLCSLESTQSPALCYSKATRTKASPGPGEGAVSPAGPPAHQSRLCTSSWKRGRPGLWSERCRDEGHGSKGRTLLIHLLPQNAAHKVASTHHHALHSSWGLLRRANSGRVGEIPMLGGPKLFSGILHPICTPSAAGRPHKHCFTREHLSNQNRHRARRIKYIDLGFLQQQAFGS